LLKRSESLAGYAEFVAQVREREGAMSLEQAVAEAIRRCARNGVLAGKASYGPGWGGGGALPCCPLRAGLPGLIRGAKFGGGVWGLEPDRSRQ
jgi:hypothetical protein